MLTLLTLSLVCVVPSPAPLLSAAPLAEPADPAAEPDGPLRCPAEKQPGWKTGTDHDRELLLRACEDATPDEQRRAAVPDDETELRGAAARSILPGKREPGQPASADPGSQWGLVTLTAVSVTTRATGFSSTTPMGVVAIGPRFGLRERRRAGAMAMPAVSGVIGASLGELTFSPFIESRFELGLLYPGGGLQPRLSAWVAAGMSLLGRYDGGNFSLAPHVGFGVGWNWLPGSWGWLGGGGGGFGGHPAGLLVGIVALAAVAAVVFAGKLEVRYTQDLSGLPGFVSVNFGFGS